MKIIQKEKLMNSFSVRLKELRKSYNYTQKELADEIGASEDSIYAWENGRRMPSVAFLTELCRIFRISADYLMGMDD